MPRTLVARAAIGAIVLLGASLSACSSSGQGSTAPGGSTQNLLDRAPVASDAELAQSPTAAAIKKRGQLTVGGSLDAPLLSQQNPVTGGVEGFDATLGKLLAKYITGQPAARIIESSSVTREPLLANGTVDVVLQTYTISQERAKKVSFAGPYLVSGQAIATLKETTGISKPQDLAGKKVVAGANTPAIAAVKEKAPTADVVTFDTDPECVLGLEQGRGVAYVQDLTLLAAQSQLNKKIKIVGQPFTSDPYGIGLKLGDDTFKKFVNDWLKKIQDAGLWQEAWKSSLGTVVEGEAPTPPAIGSVPGS
ncbi:glutamate ABC transporter substrate-binding protein [Amycolatopsis sp. CA-230715]|uniref:glutamate ABC transporter substrate-binding protein n=1 Tax=Amycolatopsis sp. CA-230715 TaxID=2745196 RepID=UPI001C031EBB|nr:glutamate ABC transporter substrate-binding protein [Amycolatopsis sp. CA-230715]QWF78642.1 ABC transporter glutamine-binding protein GlnH [Amycolatopsis sp. CA-230715]